MNNELLLHNQDKMETKTVHFTTLACGHTPQNRPIEEYMKHAVIFLDKPSNPSSHEVVSWIKRIIGCEKTGHGGTLDPKVSGTLLVCIDRATRLTKSMQCDGKTYVCTIKFEKKIKQEKFKTVVEKLTGKVFQRPPLMCAVKRQLRIRNIEKITVLEIDKKKALFLVDCEAGTYIRSLCQHIGLLLGNPAEMEELRRVNSGRINESEVVTMHDVLDAWNEYKTNKDEVVLKKVFRPLESILIGYKRIMIKDSSVSAVCAGAQLTIPGVVKFDINIEISDLVVLITTKGEAVAIGNAVMSSNEIKIMEHGIVIKTKRVIMDKNLYPKVWSIKKKYDLE